MELSKQGLFGTPNSWQDIEDFIMRMPKESRAEATVACGLTWNLAVSASQVINKEKKNDART